MNSYDKALAKRNRAKLACKKANDKLHIANKELKEAIRDIELVCDCGSIIKVRDIELIEEEFGGYWSCSEQENIYEYKRYFVCPSCSEIKKPLEDEIFVGGFGSYVKIVHKWNSDSQSCHGKVLELLKPYFDKRSKREEKEFIKNKIKEAKHLLKKYENQ